MTIDQARNEDSIIDIESYSARNETPPRGAQYRIRVDKGTYVVPGPSITGRQILELSGHTPPEHWRLDQRFRGGATKKVELAESVDLTTAGLERFMTLPLDQTEG